MVATCRVAPWYDEEGHDESSSEHRCARPDGPHTRHICECGAEMWMEKLP